MKQSIQELTIKFWSNELSATEKQELLNRIGEHDPQWMEQLEAAYRQSLENPDLQTGSLLFFEEQYQVIMGRISSSSGQSREQGAPVESAVQPTSHWGTQLAMAVEPDTGTSTIGNDPSTISVEYSLAPESTPRISRIKQWCAAAAAILIIAAAFYFTQGKQSQTKSPVLANVDSLERPTTQGTVLENLTDSIHLSVLPDGSVLQLYPGSRLSYDASYGSVTRSINLQKGQAFFAVAKDKQHPFIVTARSVLVRAVGTAFTVNNTKNGKISVLMSEGRVAVTPGPSISGKDIMLNAGDELHLDLIRNSFRVQVTPAGKINNPSTTTARKQPSLHTGTLPSFRQTSLDEVFSILQKHYAVTIRFEPQEVNGMWFTGDFTTKESLTSILATICRMNKLEVRFENNEFLITKK
ncbi:MAG: FecR domain-containing protein [Chitinophagaceae bacterium]